MTQELDRRISEHDRRIQMVESQNEQNAKQVGELIQELRTLSHGLAENITVFREYTVRHDNLKESNSKLWRKFDEAEKLNKNEFEAIKKQINTINLVNTGNQQIIDDVKVIKNKVLLLVTAAVLSPIAVGASVFISK